MALFAEPSAPYMMTWGYLWDTLTVGIRNAVGLVDTGPLPETPMPPVISGKSIVSSYSVPDTNAQIMEQQKAWQASNQGFMNALAMQIDTNEQLFGGDKNWLLIGIAALGVVVGAKLLFGRR